MTHDDKLRVVFAMQKYGGNFVKALAAMWLLADEDNCARVETTWPEYIEKYRALVDEADTES